MIVELPIFLYNKKMADMEIKTDDIPAKLTVEANQIEFLRQRGSDEENCICDKTCTIGLKSGESFIIEKPYLEMYGIWMKNTDK